jgi:hypothetical protein
MTRLIASDALEAALLSSDADIIEEADMNCVAGYDSDGSTSFDIFENGFDLALEAREKNSNVYYANFNPGNFNCELVIFVIAESEEQVVEIVNGWPDREKTEGEIEETTD